jgi:hypothetical protein
MLLCLLLIGVTALRKVSADGKSKQSPASA